MGNAHKANSARVGNSASSTLNDAQYETRSDDACGTIIIKVTNLPHVSGRIVNEVSVFPPVSPRGTIISGSATSTYSMQKAIGNSEFKGSRLDEIQLPDNRAQKLMVSYCNGWHLIPYPEPFSRHSGTCVVLGDKTDSLPPFEIKVGDCFRIGSVGLMVSETKLEGQTEAEVGQHTMQFLKDELVDFSVNETIAPLAADEAEQYTARDDVTVGDETLEQQPTSAPPLVNGMGLTNGERFICYMCYETHDTEDDPLVAPCDCTGDTRYAHVQCMQKWHSSTHSGVHAQVIRTTGSGAPACKICGAAYRTQFRKADGSKNSLIQTEQGSSYLCLVVITRHDTNPGLFNTKFRLSFGRSLSTPEHITDEELNTITLGRSSTCNMILDYRTVSTIHAKISLRDGKFLLMDQRSSNGTMVYLQDPFPIPSTLSSPVRLRMGRTSLQLHVKHHWKRRMQYAFSCTSSAMDNVMSISQGNIISRSAESNSSISSGSAQPTAHYFHRLFAEEALLGASRLSGDELSSTGITVNRAVANYNRDRSLQEAQWNTDGLHQENDPAPAAPLISSSADVEVTASASSRPFDGVTVAAGGSSKGDEILETNSQQLKIGDGSGSIPSAASAGAASAVEPLSAKKAAADCINHDDYSGKDSNILVKVATTECLGHSGARVGGSSDDEKAMDNSSTSKFPVSHPTAQDYSSRREKITDGSDRHVSSDSRTDSAVPPAEHNEAASSLTKI